MSPPLAKLLRQRLGARPDISMAVIIEEAEQETILAYLWKIHQASLLHNTKDPQSPEFLNEIWRQVGIGESAHLNSISYMKERTNSLRQLKYRYDYWLGRAEKLTENAPDKPIFLKKFDILP
jgi:hypothetical protein